MHFFYFLILFLLLSCKDNSTSCIDVSSAVRFSAEINKFESQVGASGESWHSGDAIGAFKIVGSDCQNNSYDFNVLYLCDNDGEKVEFYSQSPLMLETEDSDVTFMAYYPYSKVLDEGMYPLYIVNQSNGTRQFDLMRSIETESYSGDDSFKGVVPLRFEHCLCKIVVKFVDEDENPVSVKDIDIQGCPVSGAYDLFQHRLTIDYESEKTIKPFVFDNGKGCELILMPSELNDNQKVVYEYEGRFYNWSFINNNKQISAFKEGNTYTFTHKVGSGNQADVSQGGNSSSPWENEMEVDDVVNYFNFDIYPFDTETAFVDTELILQFSGKVPQLGNEGFIRIYDFYTDKLVDEINMSERQVKISATGETKFNTWMDVVGLSDYRLIVNYHPVRIDGNSVIIKPHSNVLDYDRRYYVTIDDKAIIHDTFDGVSGNEWFFKTRKNPGFLTDVFVSHSNHDADFYSIQGAIDHFTRNFMFTANKNVILDSGVYEEIINLRNLSNLTVKGQGSGNTEIRYDNNAEYNLKLTDGCLAGYLMKRGENIPCDTNGNSMGGGRANMLIAGNSDKIRFEDITFRNTYHTKTQCEVLCIRNKSNNATAFIRCKFLGRQDTLQPGGGFNWFYQCYVEGDTDFVWGGNSACLFEECELKMITSGGRGFNARVGLNKLGYVFYKSKLTVADGVDNCRLMEASGDSGYDNISYIHTTIDKRFISGGICSNTKLLNPRPQNPVEGDIGLQDGCKVYNCLCVDEAGDKEELISCKVYGVDYLFEISFYDYETFFKERILILKDYQDVDWFK